MDDGCAFWERVPKVELHVHLEGAIPRPTLALLLDKYGEPLAPAELERRLACRDFPRFLDAWTWKNGFLREVEDFTLVAESAARGWAEQRLLYVEAFFSPADFAGRGLCALRIAEALREGLARVPQVEVQLVADLVRDYGPERGRRQLDELAEGRALGIVGIGIGGSEHEVPPEAFAGVYRRARRLGFRTSAHAGEAMGPQSVWGALRALEVDRIGHGVRAVEDEALLRELARRRVHLEVCPISNVRTGVVRSLQEHPLPRLLAAGVPASLNTDDPGMFGNTLAGEYRAAHEVMGLSVSQVRELVIQAARDCWLPEERREALARRVAGDDAWARVKPALCAAPVRPLTPGDPGRY